MDNMISDEFESVIKLRVYFDKGLFIIKDYDNKWYQSLKKQIDEMEEFWNKYKNTTWILDYCEDPDILTAQKHKLEKNQRTQTDIDNAEIVKRLDESIDWIDKQLGCLSTNNKEMYVNFEWLKSHIISIKYNENRKFLESIKGEQK